MFKQILVPMDGSSLAEEILPHAIAMAKAYHSEITLINVQDPLDRNMSAGLINSVDWQIQRAEVKTYLNDLYSRFQKEGLTIQTVRLEGAAPDRLIHYSIRQSTNLIMLSSRGEGVIGRWNSSSVIMKIIQQARTSLMIIQSKPTSEPAPSNLTYRRILAPVDGSLRAEYGLSTAAHLAREHNAELLIAHVVKPPELPRRTPLSAQDRTLIQQVVETNQEEASHYLKTLKTHLDGKVETCLMVEDSVAEALHALVEERDIDLTVMNAHGFGGNPRWRFGNVATNFLAYSTIPLLIVQDFSRNRLGETKEETNSGELLVEHHEISTQDRPGFWENS